MHRIDKQNAEADKHGAGKNGFTEGDPASGTESTTLSADIMDALQEEVCKVIEDPAGGNATLDKLDNTQLFTAIQTMIAAASPLKGDAHYDTRDVVDGDRFNFANERANNMPAGLGTIDNGTGGWQFTAVVDCLVTISLTAVVGSLTNAADFDIAIGRDIAGTTIPDVDNANCLAFAEHGHSDMPGTSTENATANVVLSAGEVLMVFNKHVTGTRHDDGYKLTMTALAV